MATITRITTPSLASVLPNPSANKITGLLAGEALTVGDACYIKSDGKVWKSVGAAANAAAKVDGWCLVAAAVGDGVTLLFDVNIEYAAGMTPGARLYLSATAGLLDDAATTGGTAPVAFVIDATRIRALQSRY